MMVSVLLRMGWSILCLENDYTWNVSFLPFFDFDISTTKIKHFAKTFKFASFFSHFFII